MESKYELLAKLEILKTRGIDFISVGIDIDHEKRLQSINNIIIKIMKNPKLKKILEEIADEFWEQAIQTGIIVYSEMAKTPNGEEEYLLSKEQSFFNETFETLDGEIIELNGDKKIPALVYQTKKGIY